jgi:hypothetical protein
VSPERAAFRRSVSSPDADIDAFPPSGALRRSLLRGAPGL